MGALKEAKEKLTLSKGSDTQAEVNDPLKEEESWVEVDILKEATNLIKNPRFLQEKNY